jgi:hypothetical protein
MERTKHTPIHTHAYSTPHPTMRVAHTQSRTGSHITTPHIQYKQNRCQPSAQSVTCQGPPCLAGHTPSLHGHRPTAQGVGERSEACSQGPPRHQRTRHPRISPANTHTSPQLCCPTHCTTCTHHGWRRAGCSCCRTYGSATGDRRWRWGGCSYRRGHRGRPRLRLQNTPATAQGAMVEAVSTHAHHS